MAPEIMSSKIPHMTAESAWVLAAEKLPSKEIIILCFGLPCPDRRLVRYLELLRERPELLAQTGACLICFELAKRGVGQYELEFLNLMPVVREWIATPDKADSWLYGNDLLSEVWRDLENRLNGEDPREALLAATIDDAEDLELSFPLLDEEEIEDLGLEILEENLHDQEKLREEWDDQINHYLLAPAKGCSKGFFVNKDADLERFANFRDRAISLSDSIEAAGAMLPIIEVFMAAHMRSRNFFGRKNKRRAKLYAEGLQHFAESKIPPNHAVAWLLSPTGDEDSWPKVAEHLLHFLSFVGSYMDKHDLVKLEKFDFEDIIEEFLTTKALIEPEPVLHQGWDRRRRELDASFENLI